MFTNLSLKKLDYKVIAPFYKNEYLNKIDPKNIDGKYIERLLPYTSFLFKKYNEIISPIKIKKWDPTLIHYTYYYQKLDKINKPIIITVYDLIHEKISIENGNPIFPKKRMIEVADHIIAISKKTKEDLIKIYNIEEKKISVIYLGGDHSQINSMKISSDLKTFSKPYILFVGERKKYKNFLKFISAFSLSNYLKNNFQIICFGGGNFSKTEEDLFRNLLLDRSKIHYFEGDQLDLNYFYHKARIFIFPSLYEGFGIPLLEAMNMECPVICSDRSCFPEIVNDAAILFDPKDIESLEFKMEKLIYDDQLLLNLKKKGNDNLNNYSWKKCADETEKLYKKII